MEFLCPRRLIKRVNAEGLEVAPCFPYPTVDLALIEVAAFFPAPAVDLAHGFATVGH